MDGFYNKPVVLVVHCVDTEGPIGGDVRRRLDGSKEFMDNWSDIKTSLNDITTDNFRHNSADSFGNPFMLNWFIMDFTGFKTNPKNRIEEYNDTYDNIKSLNTSIDSFHWHYHQPPLSGIGDMWSDDWGNSDEHYNILGHRIIERNDFPEVYRAGGTLEDNKCSLWLEDHLMVDYSNRVSHRSHPTDNIFDFNWCGAPKEWGYYHPSHENFIRKGSMKRYIVRSVDLESRLHTLEQRQIDQVFKKAKVDKKSIILSYFSHDHRDMRSETYRVVKMINIASKKYNIPFAWQDALKALQACEDIKPVHVKIGIEKNENRYKIYFDKEVYQKFPFVYTEDKSGNIKYHKLKLEHVANSPIYLKKCYLDNDDNFKKIGVACTSMTGNKSVIVENIN